MNSYFSFTEKTLFYIVPRTLPDGAIGSASRSEREGCRFESCSGSQFKRDVMDKREVLQIKAEIANLRRIADSLEPGSMKQALSKRAAELGKKSSPYVASA